MAAALGRKIHSLMATVPSFLTWRSLGFRNICSGNLGFLDPEPSLVPARKVLETFKEEFEIGSHTVSIETGRIARFANGSVVLTMDETNVLSTVTSMRGDGARDFLPLTVDYQEKQYAQGVIPTTFMRREGAPKERELLCGRLIDRPIRPLFPLGFYHDVQIMVNVLSSGGNHDPDVMAANATSAALMLSDIPWDGPIGVIRVGRIDGHFIFNPTMQELSSSDLNLVYACTRDKTLMIDVQAREISEKDLQTGLRLAHPEAVKYIEPQIRLAERAGKHKKEYKLSMITDRTIEKVKGFAEAPIESVFTDSAYGKFERGAALDRITKDVKVKLEEDSDEESLKVLPKTVDMVRKKIVRQRIIEKGLRVDGRQIHEVRSLHCEAGIYPILHGSALFSRGDTQVLCTVTLGVSSDAQRLDSIVGPPTKRFMLHYSFPPFSINEVGKRGGLNRREVGHGTLAEKALLAVLPPEDEFPYTVRVNSEVMASDGSTSMATVCGGSMALMDAGIPVREHVAGVSVGLVSEVDPVTGMISDYRILTDILGLEDHLGDMDFKIAGTRKGVTAIQLDIKPAGIPLDIICECLEPARKGRIQILDHMEQEISCPRTTNDGTAPRLVTYKLSTEAVRRLLPQRKKIEQETGARIAVTDGTINIVAKNQSTMEKARDKVDFLVGRDIEIGRTYKGVISSIKEYGAFVEFNGGQQGLLHISEMSHEQVSRVSDVVSIGQKLSLKCIGQDVRGNIKLSLKQTLPLLRSKTKDLGIDDFKVSAKNPINVWASVEKDKSSTTGGGDLSEVASESECNEEDSATYLTPSVVIRSAAECAAQDITDSATYPTPSVVIRSAAESAAQDITAILKKTKIVKSSPRPYSPPQKRKVADGSLPSIKKAVRKVADGSLPSIKKAVRSTNLAQGRTHNIPESGAEVVIQENESDGSKDCKPFESTNVRADSLKLGDRVTVKVYQIRAHGLVLELGGGIRGMYKFEVNGRRDFEVGRELDVKCSSFSAKGIPVFTLLDV